MLNDGDLLEETAAQLTNVCSTSIDVSKCCELGSGLVESDRFVMTGIAAHGKVKPQTPRLMLCNMKPLTSARYQRHVSPTTRRVLASGQYE
jgi:hypothetical protein